MCLLVLFPKLRLTACPGEAVTVCIPESGRVGDHPLCKTSEIVYVAGAGTDVQAVPWGPVVIAAMTVELESLTWNVQPGSAGSPLSCTPLPLLSRNFFTQICALHPGGA